MQVPNVAASLLGQISTSIRKHCTYTINETLWNPFNIEKLQNNSMVIETKQQLSAKIQGKEDTLNLRKHTEKDAYFRTQIRTLMGSKCSIALTPY